jgi:hypothetical protein
VVERQRSRKRRPPSTPATASAPSATTAAMRSPGRSSSRSEPVMIDGRAITQSSELARRSRSTFQRACM